MTARRKKPVLDSSDPKSPVQLDLFRPEEDAPQCPRVLVTAPSQIEDSPYLGPKSPAMGYNVYMESEDWRFKRRYAIFKASGRCQCCSSTERLEVHHKHYNTLYHERLEDVEVLCDICHSNADDTRVWNEALKTWAYKKYGENCDLNDEWLQDEFTDWLEWKRRFEE